MSLSIQNKNFLGVLNRLDIDVKQFPDKTFDGLFDNVPEDANYFFNWFIENISSDNALTYLEQTIYFQLESIHSLPTEEEMNFTLSSCNPGYEKLMSLNTNYIDNFLSQNLTDLKKNYTELCEMLTSIETNHSDVKKKQNYVKEGISIKKKQVETIKQDCYQLNLSLGCKIDEVKIFLLKDLHLKLDLNIFKTLAAEEENLLNKYSNSILFENEFFSCAKLDLLPEIKEDLTYVEISLVVSEGFLKEKKAKIDFLLDLLQKSSQKSFNYNFIQSYLVNNEGIHNKINGEIKSLEIELFDKIKMMSNNEVQKIANYYLVNKRDLEKSYLAKLDYCKNFIMSNKKINSCLLHILIRCIISMENKLNLRKELYSKLTEYEMNFSNDVSNLELRKQRYKEMSVHQRIHPLLLSLKTEMNLEENPENNEETLKKMIELILHANGDFNFAAQKLKNDLQWSVKAFFDKKLCGPTNQLLFVPVELLIKFQDCEERENNLSQKIKRLASKYVDAKETISKSDRKRLLLWIDFLTNPEALFVKENESLPL